jgi:hypothetical protein
VARWVAVRTAARALRVRGCRVRDAAPCAALAALGSLIEAVRDGLPFGQLLELCAFACCRVRDAAPCAALAALGSLVEAVRERDASDLRRHEEHCASCGLEEASCTPSRFTSLSQAQAEAQAQAQVRSTGTSSTQAQAQA